MSRREEGIRKIQAIVRWIVGGGELILVVGIAPPNPPIASSVMLDTVCGNTSYGSGPYTLRWLADHICSKAVERERPTQVRVYATRGLHIAELVEQIRVEGLYLRAEEVTHGRGAPATTPRVNVADLTALTSGEQLSIKYDAENDVITTKTSRS